MKTGKALVLLSGIGVVRPFFCTWPAFRAAVPPVKAGDSAYAPSVPSAYPKLTDFRAQVSRSGTPRRLHAMNPYERRVVHMTVREHPGLTTVSEGDGFMKRVRVEKRAT